MEVLKLLVFFITIWAIVRARKDSPLLDESRGLARNKAAECIFGKQIRELGSQWIPDLGVPIGVLYCMKCECVPFQRKRRIVARVQCRNIKNECPEPTCDDPVLLPERCCKTCPGDNKNEPDVIQDIVPQNVIEEEERRINHFAALLTGRSSLDLKNDSEFKDSNDNNVVATGRFTFHRTNLHYSFYISEKAARPDSLHFLDSEGSILEEFTLSQPGGLVNSLYQNATRKVCGIWRRLPKDYRRLLKNEKMYVVLNWGAKNSELSLSGKLTTYVALASEQFSSLLEPPPGSDPVKMVGSGGMAILSTSSTPSPSIHVAVVFNGLFTNRENFEVPININLGLEERRQSLIQEEIKVLKPASDLNFIEFSTPVSLADLRSLSRGRVLLTVSSKSEPIALRLSGNIMTKVTCEIFQSTLIADRDLAAPTTGLAWMYLNNQGALIYNIQVDNMDFAQYHPVTLTDNAGKKKAEVLNANFNSGFANGIEDKLVHKILEPLYNSRLDIRIAIGNGSVHGHLNSKLVADARDAQAPLLLKRENRSLSPSVVGIAWISVDSDCHIHYDVSVSGLGQERKMKRKMKLYLEMYPIIASGAPVSLKDLDDFEGNQVEGSPLEALTKEELDLLDSGVTFIKIKDFNSKDILLSATITKVKLPMSCRPPYRDNNVPVIYDVPGGQRTEDCFHEGKFYKKDSTWVSKNPCQMCFCQDGQTTCDKMNCPNLKCQRNNITIPGECCPVCNDSEISKINRKCVFNGMTYSSGSKFHPFLVPLGFDDCTVCTCDPIDLEIKCRRIESNSAKCNKAAAPNTLSEDDYVVELAPRKELKEEVSNAELILKEGGCKNHNNPDKPYKNGTTYHPQIASLGEYKCVSCKCQNGKPTCARESCEWKNCKMIFDLRKARSKTNKRNQFSFSDYCCSLKVCRKIRHKKKIEERLSNKQ